MRTATVSVFCMGLAAAALVPASAGSGEPAQTDRTRVFGFLPVVSPNKLVRRFEPLVDHLAAALGVPIMFESAPDYAEFTRRTHEEKRYDFLFTAPHFYYLAQRKAGYRVVARVDGQLLRSVIVARRDSAVRVPKDLCGITIATPDPLALSTVLARQRLIDAGCDPGGDTILLATPSHNASLYSVFRGASDAAVLGTVPLARAAPEVTAKMRTIAETVSTPNMPMSVAPWIAEEEAEHFAATLIGLTSTDEGRALLEHLGWPGFTGARPGEYDFFEKFSDAIAGG